MPLKSKYANNLLNIPGLKHAFFTRKGGVSDGIYNSLNAGFGSRDTKDNLAENRNRIAAHLNVNTTHLITVHQHHSSDVYNAEKPWRPENAPKADAIVTRKEKLATAVLTADCTPVLFADPENKVIGCAHAGWKGTLAGILENTIIHMEKLGASRNAIIAAIGPTISQTAYEVSDDFRQIFLKQNKDWDRFFIPGEREHHFMFDLPGFVTWRLQQAGITNIENTNLCTYSNDDLFFSYRRSVHRQENDYGRQLSAIVLRG
jgi:YfiH family protein